MLYCIQNFINNMKIALSQIENFENTPSKIKIHWKERKNCTRQELVNELNSINNETAFE